MREREVEDYLKQMVKSYDGMFPKVEWVNRRGAPDRRVMLPDFCCWVEVKGPDGKLEPHQVREHARMRSYGEDVRVVWNFDDVDDLIRDYLAFRTEESK